MNLRLADDGTSRVLPLKTSPLLIGRIAEADLRLLDRSVARRHALLVEYITGWVIHDLSSIAGVRINGTKVARGELHVGDRVDIGNNRFTVQIDETPSNSVADSLSDSRERADSENWLAEFLQSNDSSAAETACELEFHLDGKMFRVVPIPGDVILGYAPRAHICLPRRQISSLHCLLSNDRGTWYLHDLRGGTGIRIADGSRVQTLRLDDGTEFEVGEFQVTARITALPDGQNSASLGSTAELFAGKTEVSIDPDAIPQAPILPRPALPVAVPPPATDSLPPAVRITLARAERALRDGNDKAAVALFAEVCKAAPLVLRFREALRRAQKKCSGRTAGMRRSRKRLRLAWRQSQAKMRLSRGDWQGALEVTELGLRHDPWNKGLLMLQALIFERQGRMDLVLFAIKSARERDPHDVSFNRPLAKMMQSIGAYDRAVHYWRQVKEELPNDRAVDDQIRMAMVQKTLKAGSYDEQLRDEEHAELDNIDDT